MKRTKTQLRLAKLVDLFQGETSLLIVLQDFPDPDAIAAAAALQRLANAMGRIQCSVCHGGIVGRAENRAMVDYLDVNLRPLDRIDFSRYGLIAMVDTQPGTGNNSLPREITPDIVIDHHPIRHATRCSPFIDIRRRYGATSTILFEYLRDAGVAIDVPLATALSYGIYSDTQDLGREYSQPDIDAFAALHPSANKRMLREIQWGRVPRVYFQMLASALKNATVHGSAMLSGLGDVHHPDMIGEVADLLLRNKSTRWVLCYGFYDRKLLFSLRSHASHADAGKIAARMVAGSGSGGGHHGSAGGRIVLAEGDLRARLRAERRIVQRFLHQVRQEGRRGVPLVTL